MITLEEIKAVVFGHAIGDALGFPVEFFTRQELEENPVVDMLKNEMYNTPAGAWSDDTSMALCAIDSLSTGKLDFDDVMQKFGKWYYQNEYTVAGKVIGEGNTCSLAIENYFKHNKTIYDCGLDREDTNGNGSLMRIYPFVLYLANKNISIDKKINIIQMASALTHAHQCSKVACGIYAFVLWELLNTKTRNKLVIRNALTKAKNYYSQYTELDLSYFNGLFDEISFVCGKCDNIALENKINTSGYVVDTLVASIYCLFATNSYSECVLKAVNLGDDTDTTAAVAGSIAGLLYGYDSIPKTWIKALVKQEYIESICNKANYIWSNNITIQKNSSQ